MRQTRTVKDSKPVKLVPIDGNVLAPQHSLFSGDTPRKRISIGGGTHSQKGIEMHANECCPIFLGEICTSMESVFPSYDTANENRWYVYIHI